MKRYLLFTGERLEPLGGWSDFKSDHDDREEALALAREYFKKWPRVWCQVVDTAGTGEIILRAGEQFY